MAMKVDVAIIGAGPAGLCAAIETARAGLSVIVVDEYFRPGGRLLGQLYEDPKAPVQDRMWDGKKIAERLEQQVRHFNVTILCGVSAWAVSKKWKIQLSGRSEKYLDAKAVLLATGAVERAVPLPGWTLPGVVSIGAAQTFTNVHHVAIGKRVIVVGIDPLSISVALEMKNKGIEIVRVVLPPVSPATVTLSSPIKAVKRLAEVSEFAPNAFLSTIGRITSGGLHRIAAYVLRLNLLRIKGVPILLRKCVTSIKGTGCVEAVNLQTVSIDGRPIGEPEEVLVDGVCLSGGLYPLVELAQVIGCPLVNIPELGGVVPVHGPDMSTPIPGLFVAGNITGIENAKVAMAQGRLAGVTIARFLGRDTQVSIDDAIHEVDRVRNQSAFKFLPDIEKGRLKMHQLWTDMKLEKTGVM